MIIRQYLQADREAVVSLWIKCNLVVPWNNPYSDIDRKMKVDPELFLVGLFDDKLMATVMGGYEGHRGWVNYLAVDPQYQGQKYGKQMMDEIEKRLLAMECPKVQLQIRSSNKSVIDFYKAIGYKEDDVLSFGKRLIEDKPLEENSD